MSHFLKSPPSNGFREAGGSPFITPSQRNVSRKRWSSPNENWQNRTQSPSQNHRSPHHHNLYSSPNVYWASPRPCSPNQWGPPTNYQRNWSSSPRTPKYSPFHNQSPMHGSFYPERKSQVQFRRNHKDISHYYSPSMVQDPWKDLETNATKTAPST